MKKILVLFGIIAIAPLSVSAYINEGESTSMKTLQTQGFSPSTIQAVDWTKYRNQGSNGRYVRYYQQKQNGFLGRAYHRLKTYVDPYQDDGKFGDTHIQFSNTWMGDDTFYSDDYSRNRQVENL